MSEILRKKSPRAPSIPLDEAVERVLKIYDKERRHAAPTDVIAQNLGYKNANNGAALSMIASLRSYGLLEKAPEGKLAVSKDAETYRFAPSDELKSQLRIKWLKTPNVFSELLDKYVGGLPSDASIRFELIQKGFTPASAESTLTILKKSVDFSKFFEQPLLDDDIEQEQGAVEPKPQVEKDDSVSNVQPKATDVPLVSSVAGFDRIPVRLAGGRRAWLEIPTPFYAADKLRLKAQIDLLLTEEEEAEPDSE